MQKQFIGACVLVAAACLQPALAAVELTANGGAVTQYIFRGVPQTDGKAAAQGGADVAASGFYAGTWISQVDVGLEYDLYAGYGFDVQDFNFGIGGTGYFYTDDFDEDYIELNLSAGWKFVTLDYALGEYDSSPVKSDYDFLSITLERRGFYGRFGTWGKDFDGDYWEAGYGNTLTVGDRTLFDYQFAIIRSDENLSLEVDADGRPTENTFFYAGIVKTFGLSKQ